AGRRARDVGHLDLLAGAEARGRVEPLEELGAAVELLAQRFERRRIAQRRQLRLLDHVLGHARERALHVVRRDRVGDQRGRGVLSQRGGGRRRRRGAVVTREGGQG